MSDPGYWLPVAFMALMGLSVLAYVVLDGFDLGVGMLACRARPSERDPMVSSIGPFWDANETWLVLGVGILLVAFPRAHGLVLGALYLPVAFMLVGLILRSPHAHARIVSLDVGEAAALPGVKAVVTCAERVSSAVFSSRYVPEVRYHADMASNDSAERCQSTKFHGDGASFSRPTA